MDTYSDDQMREMALSHAVMATDNQEGGDVVVKNAEKFYKFMKGVKTSDGQE